MGLLLALAGHPASGKTTFASILETEFGFEKISGSEILQHSVKEIPAATRPFLITRKDFDAYHRAWRRRHGIDAMGTHALRCLASQPDKRVCFENVRNIFDARKMETGGALIVALQCAFHVRFARASTQAFSRILTMEGFFEAEAAEYDSSDLCGSHVERVLNAAHITLDASQPIEAVMRELQCALSARGITI